MSKINVFVVGSKGIPARYGGFETFVENLTKRKQNPDIHYFVSAMGGNGTYSHNGATCFSIPLKKDSAFKRIFNISNALSWVEKYIRSHPEEKDNIVYILGCRVGLLIGKHKRILTKLGCIVLTNPDGLEWKRDKWNYLQKKVLLLSENKLLKHSDYIVFDSIGVRQFVSEMVKLNPDKTTYIAYGNDVAPSKASDAHAIKYLDKFSAKPHEYYLIVSRFVPENNFELIIREFMKSKTDKKLFIITNHAGDDFYKYLLDKTHFNEDKRIVFAGTLYDEELLKKVRELAFAYIHGHSVGGTNPSLLEAIASTKINLLYDVPFNREVGDDQCLYFSNKEDDLKEKIAYIEENHEQLSKTINPRDIALNRYSWESIIEKYESFFLKVINEKK